jgi:hypothetical protein
LFKIVQTPSVIVFLHEAANSTFRQILTDGRELPVDPNPTWLGYSVGHWEGDTLVVESAGFNDKTTLDAFFHPHTEELRITERFHRLDFGHLEMKIAFDDPKAYNRRWTITAVAQLMPNMELVESVCNEGEQDSTHLVGRTEEEAEVNIAASILKKYTGTYQVSPGRDVVVTMEDGELMVDYTQGRLGNIPLFARSDTEFLITLPALGPPTQFEFFSDSTGAVTHLVWHTRDGDQIKAFRTSALKH